MKVQITIDIPEISSVGSDELDGIREAIGIAVTESGYISARVVSAEVVYEQ